MDSRKSNRFTRLLETTARQSPQQAIIYTIKRGDTLHRIIYDHYKALPNTVHYQVAEASILEFNQHIKSPSKVYAGSVVRLMPLPNPNGPAGSCVVPKEYYHSATRAGSRHRLELMPNDRSARIRNAMPKNEQEQAAFNLLSSLENNHGLITTAVGGGVNAFGNLVGQGNSETIRQITEIYDGFKADKMTENQYNYRRQKVLKDLANRMGPLLEREKLRIDRRKGVVPTATIERQANRIARLSRYATRGGVVLGGVGIAMGCRDIANTDNQQEKNEILVETVTGTTVGLIGGYALAIVLASNPVGWTTAIVLGVGAAATSFASGKVARKVYDTQFNEYDLANMSGIDKLCK